MVRINDNIPIKLVVNLCLLIKVGGNLTTCVVAEVRGIEGRGFEPQYI